MKLIDPAPYVMALLGAAELDLWIDEAEASLYNATFFVWPEPRAALAAILGHEIPDQPRSKTEVLDLFRAAHAALRAGVTR